MTWTFSAALTLNGTGSQTFTSNGITTTVSQIQFGHSGTITLQDDLVTTGNIGHITGTVDANNKNVTTLNYDAGTAGTKTLTMGSGTWTLTGTSTVWTAANLTTLNANTSTIKVTDTSASTCVFAGSGKTYSTVWLARGTSSGINTIAGSNTFAILKDTGTVAHTTRFTAGTTQIISTASGWQISGNSGQLITINSTTTGTHTLSCASGNISADYLNIQHSVAQGGAKWFAGANSTNNQATATAGSGWIFQQVKSLIIAGGGGGGIGASVGARWGGGGGAGGYQENAAVSVTAQAYTITVGTGGSGGAGAGDNGTDSSAFGITSTGGGGGAAATSGTGLTGGSGGGGAGAGGGTGVLANGGAGTGGQGNNGGAGFSGNSSTGAGGSGGGSGGVGGNASASTGGNGGAGTASSINGSSVTRAGGGGGGGVTTGGTGGSGGGGAGGTDGAGANATANTGSGGGGAKNGFTGGNGADGVVIISFITTDFADLGWTCTGGTITTSGSNTIHTFNSSGTFTITASATNNAQFLAFM